MSRWIAALAAAAIVAASSAYGQEDPAKNYPSKPVRALVPFAAGGGVDYIARVIVDKMFEGAAGRIVIENKPGGGGILASETVARATPDGYTLFFAPPSPITLNPALYSKLPYNPDDLVPISQVVSFPMVLVANKDLPVKTAPELVAWAKANPAKSNFGGTAATFQMLGFMFRKATGIPYEFINYKSTTEVTTAMMGGDIAMGILDTGPISAPIKNGQIKALAVTPPTRSEFFPNIPTFKEQGIDVEYVGWVGIFAPKGTPQSIINKIEAEAIRAMKNPDVQKQLRARETQPTGSTAEAFRRAIKIETERWAVVAKENNFKLD
jgi:tripartite-type tricarboxylate transporter receptor subunit TctC